jgi:hypothetical protein
MVGQQAQPCGRADLDQRQRPGQPREDRQQHRAAPRLVGLHRVREHRGAEGVLALQDAAAERVPAGGRAEQQAERGEQEVRLPLPRGRVSRKPIAAGSSTMPRASAS